MFYIAQKQEAQGPNCPPAKPVHINKHIYDYIKSLIRRRKYSLFPLLELNGSSFDLAQ